MTKNINISVDDWVFNEILEKRLIKNRSEWVQELIIKGYNSKKQGLGDNNAK